MKRLPRNAAWWGVLAAGAVGLLPACDGGDGTGSGASGGGSGGATTTDTRGGGGSGGTGGEAGQGGSGGEAGQGGSGGQGGNGGGPTGLPDGDPCTADAQCEHGFCLTQAEFGWPYGACTGACNSFIDCAAGSTCSEVANNPFCLKLCATNDDCKQGKLCTDIGGGESACLPNCTSDAECEGYGSCNEVTGDCTPDEDCDVPGDEDDDVLSDCEDGECTATATCAPLIAAACTAAAVLPIVTGEPLLTNGDTTGQESLFGGYCAGGGNGEDVYEIAVPAGVAGLLDLSLVSTTADLAIYVRDACETDSSSVCLDEEQEGTIPETLVRSVTGPKTVWVFVDGSTYGSPKEGPYSLTATLYAAQIETEPNDDSTSSNDVMTPTTASLMTGNLNQAMDDDDWFRIDTSALAGNKTITFETAGFGGTGCAPFAGDVDTYLEVVAADGTTVLGSSEDIDFASNYCSRVQLAGAAPGEYFVHVQTSPLCVADPMGPDCVFSYGLKILIQDP